MFTLRSGAGDDGGAGTQSAAFAAGGFAVIGGIRTVGRTMPTRRTAFGAFDDTLPRAADGVADVAVSPPGTPPEQAGAIAVSAFGQLTRQTGTDPWSDAEITTAVDGPVSSGFAQVTGIAWNTPSTVILAGRSGLLIETPVPALRTGAPEEGADTPSIRLVPAATGLDLLDVAANGEDAWAVGRKGAAVHRSDGRWTAVKLPPPLDAAQLIQVAYAGEQALVASTAGLLVASPAGQLAVDTGLADLMREDGRPVASTSVTGLPDGAAVVDGRYVRDSATSGWRRLADPAEGDVIALGLWRDPAGGARILGDGGAETVSSLRVVASIADTGRPLFGAPMNIDFGGDEGSGGRFTIEAMAAPSDGRLATLGADGWTDLVGVPLTRATGRDLSAWSPPFGAVAVDAAGNGWAVGGVGSTLDLFAGQGATAPTSVQMPLGRQAVDTRPPDVRAPADAPRAADAPLRLFFGGHPACLDECAGRADQGTAPDANVRDALAATHRLGDPAAGPTVLVVGGGRASAGGAPLTPAGARRYAQLLRSDPSITVAAAIGTADAATPASRAAFRSALAGVFPAIGAGPRAVQPVADPAPPLTSPGSDVVAYAFDVPHRDRAVAARVIVIDNAGGELRGGASGEQAQWLSAVLSSPTAGAAPKIVVGAARLDDDPGAARDRAAELALLAAGGASAYVATDGGDDVNAASFGGHTAATMVDVGGRAMPLYRTSGLGHAMPYFTYMKAFQQLEDEESEAAVLPVLIGRSDGWDGPALLSLDIDPVAPPRGVVVPVFTHLSDGVTYARAGRADYFLTSATSGAGAGFLWQDPAAVPPAAPAEARSGGALSFLSFACQVLGQTGGCENELPADMTFRVADPSIAVFVRALPRGRTGDDPKLVFDASGNPIPDPASAVLCPIRAGQTTITVTVSGSSATYPLRVSDRGSSAPRGAACSFRSEAPPSTGRPPVPATPATPAPVSPPAPTPIQAPPSPALPPGPLPSPSPTPAAPAPAPAPPLAVLPPAFAAAAVAGGVNPPVALNPKPAPTPPPATPTGMSSQFAPQTQLAPQAQLSPARQQQRQAELAREGTRLGATVYEPRDQGVPAGAILGGAGLLLTAGAAGAVVGHRRRAAMAAARRRVTAS